jgi:hypothetical protein
MGSDVVGTEQSSLNDDEMGFEEHDASEYVVLSTVAAVPSKLTVLAWEVQELNLMY